MITSAGIVLLGVFISILTFWFTRLLYSYLKKYFILMSVPSPPGFRFLLGHKVPRDSVAFYKQLSSYCDSFYDEPVFCYWIGPIPVVCCNHPSTVEALLGNNENITKSKFYDCLHPWLGLGLLTSTGSKWKSRRKLLTPAFHFSILQNFNCLLNEHASQLVNVISQRVSSLTDSDDQPQLNIHPLIVHSALDVICESAMGHNLNSIIDTDNIYAHAIKKMTDIVMQRMKNPHLYFNFIFSLTKEGREHSKLLKVIHGFTSSIIRERRQQMKDEGVLHASNFDEISVNRKKWRLAFLDLLLHEQYLNDTLSDSDIQEEVDTFMFEGHDTTAVAMTWCLYNVGLNRRVQEKLHEELDEVFPNKTCDVTNEHIGKLKYLDLVIKESLRLFPSVPFFARDTSKKLKLDKYQIPVGCTILVMPPSLHRNQLFYSRPNDFYPERFLESRRHPYEYVPFSAGSRNCIGARFAQLEMKTTLSWLLRSFRIRSTQTMEDCHPAGDIILKPRDGILLDMQLRD